MQLWLWWYRFNIFIFLFQSQVAMSTFLRLVLKKTTQRCLTSTRKTKSNTTAGKTGASLPWTSGKTQILSETHLHLKDKTVQVLKTGNKLMIKVLLRLEETALSFGIIIWETIPHESNNLSGGLCFWQTVRVHFFVSRRVSFHMTKLHWNNSVKWNVTLPYIRNMDP